MDDIQTSYDDHSDNRADHEDSGSQTEVFFNNKGSTRQAEGLEQTQHDTSVTSSYSPSVTCENEQTVAAASLMQLHGSSQNQARGSSVPNLVSSVHQGPMVSSHGNFIQSMQASGLHPFNRGANVLDSTIYSEANMRNTITGLSNALVSMQQQQVGLQQQQVNMEVKQDSISGTLTNVLSILQELTKKSQNSSQNNSVSSIGNGGCGPSSQYHATNLQSTLNGAGSDQVTDRAQDRTSATTYTPMQALTQNTTGDNYCPTSCAQQYDGWVENERLTGRTNSDRDYYYRTNPMQTQSFESDNSSGHVQFRMPENTHVPYRARQSQSDRFQSLSGVNDVKLPPFNGKEDWKVWVSRFEAIAERRSWPKETKLDNLLPKLQGKAGEFVFTQLPRLTLSDYDALIKELNSRFRVVETKKTFAAKFSQRTQKPGETAEEFAAELKRLYAKAYSFRDENTRQEDLVRRFLDGLRDSDARFEVEYNKEPENIDEAVYHAVNFAQTKHRGSTEGFSDRKFKRYARRSRLGEESSGEESQDDNEDPDRVCRLPSKKESDQKKKAGKEDSGTVKPMVEVESLRILTEAKDLLKTLMTQMQVVAKGATGTQQQESRPFRGRSIVCYGCQEVGHVIRDCPKKNNKIGHNKSQGGARSNEGIGQASNNGSTNRQPLN